MSSLPGQLSATAPAFVPAPQAKTPRLVQRRRPGQTAAPQAVGAKAADTRSNAGSALYVADRVWAPVSPSQGNWSVPTPPTKACVATPGSTPRPQASYANALKADPAHQLATGLDLIRPSTRADGRWQVSDAQEEALIAQIGSLLKVMGEPETKRLLVTARVLLPRAPVAQDVLQAMELMQATAPEHRQAMATLCYRMSNSGSAESDNRLAIARDIAAHSIDQVSAADQRLNRLYRAGGLHPLAANDHWKLCVGLMSLGAAAQTLDEQFDGPGALDKTLWAGLVQQWLRRGPEVWLKQLDSIKMSAKRSHQAHRLLVDACAEHCVCLPPALEACLVTFLASHEDDAVKTAQALQTTTRLLPAGSTDAEALRIWRAVSGLKAQDQAHLLALIDALRPSPACKQDRIDAIELLCTLSLSAASEAHTILQKLCDKADFNMPRPYQMKLVLGLTQLDGDMKVLQSVCQDPELDAESVAGLLARMIDLDPAAWLDEAQARLLTAQEFVTVHLRDVPTATMCASREDARRQYRAFSVF